MKRSTVIVLVIFLALAGLVIYLNQREPTVEETDVPTAEPARFLFTDSDGLPTSIDVQDIDGGRQTVIARNDAGVWVLEKPIEAGADQASAQAAASQLTALRILSTVEVAPADVGLAQPSYVLIVKSSANTQKTVRIGDLTPTESGYYAQSDGSGEIVILSKNGVDALFTLLDSPPVATEMETTTP